MEWLAIAISTRTHRTLEINFRKSERKFNAKLFRAVRQREREREQWGVSHWKRTSELRLQCVPFLQSRFSLCWRRWQVEANPATHERWYNKRKLSKPPPAYRTHTHFAWAFISRTHRREEHKKRKYERIEVSKRFLRMLAAEFMCANLQWKVFPS